ncbi:hypothetical protein J1605_009213, partial [Eschrichtius robustus]
RRPRRAPQEDRGVPAIAVIASSWVTFSLVPLSMSWRQHLPGAPWQPRPAAGVRPAFSQPLGLCFQPVNSASQGLSEGTREAGSLDMTLALGQSLQGSVVLFLQSANLQPDQEMEEEEAKLNEDHRSSLHLRGSSAGCPLKPPPRAKESSASDSLRGRPPGEGGREARRGEPPGNTKPMRRRHAPTSEKTECAGRCAPPPPLQAADFTPNMVPPEDEHGPRPQAGQMQDMPNRNAHTCSAAQESSERHDPKWPKPGLSSAHPRTDGK